MTRTFLALRGKRGTAYTFAAFLALSIVVMSCAAMEYMRLKAIAKGVRDAVQSAVVSVAVGNYADVYAPVRDGYASGQAFDEIGGSFAQLVDAGDVYGRLDGILGLDDEGGGRHVKYKGGGPSVEYTLSGLSASVVNTPLAPSGPGATQMFHAEATIRLEVPLSFGWQSLPPVSITLRSESGWREKF
jgi:hypothetical protein